MTKAMRKITAILLSVLLCCSAVTSLPVTAFAAETNSAVGVTSGMTGSCTWTFDEATGTLTISGNGKMGDCGHYQFYDYDYYYETLFIWDAPWKNLSVKQVVINNGVTNIGKWAFYGCKEITSVQIGNGIKTIPFHAFYGCTKLTNITLSNGITEISQAAFYGCTELKSISIPNSVKNIDRYAFKHCSSLTSISIGNGVTDIGYCAFYGCSKLNAVYISDVAAWCKIKFHSSVSNPLLYAHNLYLNNQLVTNLVIPYGVTSIGEYAFEGCAKPTKYATPDSADFVFDHTLEESAGIVSVSIPSSVTTIGRCAFKGCAKLSSINIPKSVTSIGNYAFSNCIGLSSVTIPNGMTNIGSAAFYGCKGLKSIFIPHSVTSIGDAAFKGCTGLTSISVDSNNNTYDSRNNCNAIISSKKNQLIVGCQNSTIPISVTDIGDSAFYGCTGLTSVTIPDRVTRIGNSAFYNCTGLVSVNIPDSVTGIGQYAFSGCTELKEVHISDIAAWCRIDFNSNPLVYAHHLLLNGQLIKNLVIPDGVTNIGNYAFSGCTELTSVTIPDSVTIINNSAFSGCTGLTSVTIPDSVTIINNSAFSDCTGLTSITIPDSVTSIGWSAFSGCTGLTSVTIPDSVISIDWSSFKGCPNLTIIGLTESKAYQYAHNNKIPFIDISNGTAGITGECKWTFSEVSGVLTISGNGSMANYDDETVCRWKELLAKEVVIGQGVTNIGTNAFEAMATLEKVTIADSVTKIGSEAFYDCENLKSVTIPESVTSIGEKAFGYYLEEYYNNDLDYGTREAKTKGFSIKSFRNTEANRYANRNAFTFNAIPVLRGDVNHDGKVNGADAGLLNRYISGWEGYEDKIKSMQCADINGDGKVQGNDAGLLNRYCSGWTGYDSYIVPIA